ncbi:T9SS type A sorting domain-containing protein [Hymenobacter aquaticus]|uniref:T9SS type A sorting domain-containing protein n=1 Tax=Hymenobacter aquaticus TaxID=1867101 RepID=A0A4Z0Q891_9BACT|nr:T9SS type A sorting domain-containing protein [Hymenobacter aquaticus]TGE24912.1 T9SS type A sorting domain-containing protein [Hymenobacter aquaticus]
MQHSYSRPLLLSAALALGCFSVTAQRFTLDTSFDTDGRVTTEITPPASQDNLHQLYPQADGKTIALGVSKLGYATVRYNADGSLDTAYGTGGKIIYSLSSQRPNMTFTLAQLQLLPNGKLLATGSSSSAGALICFNADGTIDSAFGDNGLVLRPTTATTERGSIFRSVQVQADGKLVVVGSRYVRSGGLGTYNYLLVSRYNPNGALDLEYSTFFQISPSTDSVEGFSLAIQPDGKILAGGVYGTTNFRPVFVRLLPDGTPDPAFGTAGRVFSSISYDFRNSQILLLPDGRFMVSLGSGATINRAAFARFLPSGALDTSFGVNGVAEYGYSSPAPYDVAGEYGRGRLAAQADGKIIVGGFNGTAFGVLRLNTDGTKDSSFGDNFDQTIRTDFNAPNTPTYYTVSSVASVLVLPDGKIMAGGSHSKQKGFNDATDKSTMFALARYAAAPTSTLPNGVWNGSVSTAYDNAQNWSNNVLPADTTINILVPRAANRYPTLTTAAVARNLTVEAGATLTIAATGSLTAMRALLLNGAVVGDGVLRTRGLRPQIIAGTSTDESRINTLDIGPAGASLAGPLNLNQMLILNGPLATNGQKLRLLSYKNIPSGQTSTAMVVNNGNGAVLGDVTVERNITGQSGLGYRHYSSPVTNATFGTLAYNGFVPVLNQAYNTAADPSKVTPFPNVFEYDETRLSATTPGFEQGWMVPASALQPGKGYTLNTYGFNGVGSPVSFVGTLNNGTISRTLTAGTQNESGWNFLGNPYPAPLDWNKVTIPAGVSSAAYVFRSSGDYTGAYVSYVNGIGASNVIPAMQGFFVRASVPSVTLQFTNAARLTTYANPDFLRPAADTRPQLRLDLTGPGQTQPADAAHVYFQQGATALADEQFDAYKLPGTSAQLSTSAGPDQLSINGLPLLGSQGTSVAVSVWADQAGSYTLTAGQLLNFDAGIAVVLEDKLTGAWHDLRVQPTYSFGVATANTRLTSRFVLHFGQSQALASQPSLGAASVALFPNPVVGGQLHIQLNGLSSASQKVEAQLYNALGQVVRQQRFAVSGGALDAALPVRGLSKGVYTLRLTSGQQVSAHQVIIPE